MATPEKVFPTQFTEKTTPIAGDKIPVADGEDTGKLKWIDYEIIADIESASETHIARTDNPHTVTKAQV